MKWRPFGNMVGPNINGRSVLYKHSNYIRASPAGMQRAPGKKPA